MERSRSLNAAAVFATTIAISACAILLPASAGAGQSLGTSRALVEFSTPGARSPADSVLALVPHPWPGRAMLLSVAGCAAPFAIDALFDGDNQTIDLRLLAAGTTILPALGHFYAGQYRTGLAWSLVRFAGYACLLWSLGEDSDVVDGQSRTALIGGVLVIGGALLEVIDTPGDVQRANQALAASRLQATLVPMRGGAQVRLSVAFAAP